MHLYSIPKLMITMKKARPVGDPLMLAVLESQVTGDPL